MPTKRSSPTTKLLEKELLTPVMEYLAERGCQKVVSELRFFDRGIDVYGIKDGRSTIAVELKLSDWQRALQQAAVYQLCSDLSYVAMPLRAALNLDIKIFKDCGVGILIVRPDGTVGELLEATKSLEARRHYVAAMRRSALEDSQYVRTQ